VDLDVILYEGDDIEYYLDYILFNPVSSTNPKCRTFKLLRFEVLLKWWVDLDEVLYGDNDIEGDQDSILHNHLASTIIKCSTLKLLVVCATFELIGGFG
jgi:hypothetical protein